MALTRWARARVVQWVGLEFITPSRDSKSHGASRAGSNPVAPVVFSTVSELFSLLGRSRIPVPEYTKGSEKRKRRRTSESNENSSGGVAGLMHLNGWATKVDGNRAAQLFDVAAKASELGRLCLSGSFHGSRSAALPSAGAPQLRPARQARPALHVVAALPPLPPMHSLSHPPQAPLSRHHPGVGCAASSRRATCWLPAAWPHHNLHKQYMNCTRLEHAGGQPAGSLQPGRAPPARHHLRAQPLRGGGGPA
jgi:hypothetical protein